MPEASNKLDAVSFKTRARTVDHLGREQIADCPTAISELWKNAFDAYARKASLQIFDGKNAVAGLFDNGHGMNRSEFIERWLVVGTESKVVDRSSELQDTLGLKPRSKQGQKGIGRLSCANLGPLLLLVSKRSNCDFVAALLDWRIFENPFLNLDDILIPVTEVKEASQVLDEMPGLFAKLMSNLEGEENDSERAKRVKDAWKKYDKIDQGPGIKSSPSQAIKSSILASVFEKRHFEQWDVWSSDSDHGTALLIGDINYDLKVYVEPGIDDAAARGAKDKLFETLSCFVNPFIDEKDPGGSLWSPEFEYEAKYWIGRHPTMIVGSEKQFSRFDTDPMEHRIEGIINPKGEFIGKVKAFGEWREETYRIPPPDDLNIPTAKNAAVGPVSIYIAALEFQSSNSTHEKTQFAKFRELAEKYSGLMVFRDGLRVMPYGRTDNDFFEIDDRRSKNAGREFWNNRQMFGGLAIRQRENPNLKDKAGREGIVDNVAAKTLKALISNVLKRSARDYFGSSSDIRKELLPQIREANLEERAREQRNKSRRRNSRLFKQRLKAHMATLPDATTEFETYLSDLQIESEAEIEAAQDQLANVREQIVDYKLPGAPKNLGTSEEAYSQYRRHVGVMAEGVTRLSTQISRALEEIKPESPVEVFEKHMRRNSAHIHARIRKWKQSIDDLQRAEYDRFKKLVDERNKIFHQELDPVARRVRDEEIELSEAISLVDDVRARLDAENDNIFPPYIAALESLSQSIDLELLATTSDDEIQKLETELERLNSLAQLGIAVEIIGHELESYDDIIGAGIRRLPEKVQGTAAVEDIQLGYDGLTDQLRYLSPLKLSGQKVQRWVTGAEIYDYVRKFFKRNFELLHISFEASTAFSNIRVFDQPSRLYPVFINLVNNSRYWLAQQHLDSPKIRFDVAGDEIVVSDNGPGVDPSNIESLFSLFFTTKLRGGRGIGLYLCRANLAAGGHRIRYQQNDDQPQLDGANFYIWFRGAEFDG